MKRIAIIGGGISGLTVLHYLKQRLGEGVDITLFEREPQVGGTIRTITQDGCVFEWGPNSFLDYQPATLELIENLSLTSQLIEASVSAHRRYIQANKRLYPVPMNPIDLIKTPLISKKDKWSLLKGLCRGGISKNCTIYDYFSQRFSKGIAEGLIDPMISGIYAGDIKRLHMAMAFPKMRWGQRSRMRSLSGGMGQIIETLYHRYQSHIQINTEVSLRQIDADIKVIATPAYAAARLLEGVNRVLAKTLEQIPYAPVVVVGLCFQRNDFRRKPNGFGYLIPTREHKDILGVLIESNIFPTRSAPHQIMLRVIMGGRHHREQTHQDSQQTISMALEEIESIYGLKAGPLATFIKVWPKAIPQYEMNYPHLRQSMTEECAKTPGLYLCANYIGGISFNDCVYNAKSLAQQVVI